jgi:hypothetical protein
VLVVGSGCERMVPSLAKMPTPRPELLVEVPAPAYPELTAGIREAADSLPSNPAYVEIAADLERGKPPEDVQMEWLGVAVDRALQRLHKALQVRGGRWPAGPGGPEWQSDDVVRLGRAVSVAAAAAALAKKPADSLALCLDGLCLTAYVGRSSGAEPELTAAQAERPVVGRLRDLVRSGALKPEALARLAQTLDTHLVSIRPLSQMLREGLSRAAAAQKQTLPEEWAAAVRTTWRTQPQIVPRRAVAVAWTKWADLIKAADMPPAQAQEICDSVGQVTDSIELLYASPPPDIVPGRARRIRDLHRLRLDVALARWKAANGQLPDKLQRLVPGYLPKLPPDPTTRAPFTYERKGSAYSLE